MLIPPKGFSLRDRFVCARAPDKGRLLGVRIPIENGVGDLFMSERDIIERVKARQGIFDKIQNVFTGGYGTKEDLRELDKQMRDFYYADFKAMRHRWEEIYLAALNAGHKALGNHFKKVIQALDRVGEKVNRADYGYAGLWDRKGSVRENALARMFDYDRGLGEGVKGLEAAINSLHQFSEAENWENAKTKVKRIKDLLLGFESEWDEREKAIRSLEV
jgi:hypothetical protein